MFCYNRPFKYSMPNGSTSTSKASLGNILLVDDEDHITSLLQYNLENESFGVSIEREARHASAIDLTGFRLVLADAMNQQFSGRDFLRSLKANPLTAHIPVIMVSHSDSEDDIIGAFGDGADDYILKPFSLRELIARVRSVLRRNPIVATPGKNGAVLTVGPLSIDLTTRIVSCDNQNIPLTKTEFAILSLLAKNRGTYFNRRQIYEEVWAGDYHDNDRIVDTNISRLRKKLGAAASLIVNKSGMGYTISLEPVRQ